MIENESLTQRRRGAETQSKWKTRNRQPGCSLCSARCQLARPLAPSLLRLFAPLRPRVFALKEGALP